MPDPMETAEETAEEIARRSAEIMLGRDAASSSMGMVLEHVRAGGAEVSMVVRPDMVNGHGVCHGGLLAALADTAFAVACNSYGEVTVGAGFDITFLESGRLGDRLLARAEERARRGRSGLYDVTIVRNVAERTADEAAPVLVEFRGRSRSLGRPIA